jgi:hypothetical protein
MHDEEMYKPITRETVNPAWRFIGMRTESPRFNVQKTYDSVCFKTTLEKNICVSIAEGPYKFLELKL